ncbi:MAG: UDP-N-acetylmuramate--L-alanine ligase [Fibrobacterota bacterium]
MIHKKLRIHFIGIGGAGMFPMAEVLHQQKHLITGSDIEESDVISQLRQWGVEVQIGHYPRIIKGADIVVYSSAVKEDNPELIYARSAKMTVMKRAVMLGDLMRSSFSVGISGTHGKTTTTSLIAHIMDRPEKNPTVIAGGIFKGRDTLSGALVGDGKILIAEADEYDRSFLHMYPNIAVVTNIEADHLDIYADIDAIKAAFCQFIHQVPFYGNAVVCIDDAGVRSILASLDKPVTTYGFAQDADYSVKEYRETSTGSHFSLQIGERMFEDISIPLRGKHNVLNSAAAVVVAQHMDITDEQIRSALKTFPGVKRRMDFIGERSGVVVYDDYAHHPTEIRAVLSTFEKYKRGKLYVVFQPHLYSRTAFLKDEFIAALANKNIAEVFILPIYRAREPEQHSVTGKDLRHGLNKRGIAAQSLTEEQTVERLQSMVTGGDTVLLLGAGDVWKMGYRLLKEID